jgi:hypothetical protein
MALHIRLVSHAARRPAGLGNSGIGIICFVLAVEPVGPSCRGTCGIFQVPPPDRATYRKLTDQDEYCGISPASSLCHNTTEQGRVASSMSGVRPLQGTATVTSRPAVLGTPRAVSCPTCVCAGLRVHGGRMPAGADGMGSAPLAAADGVWRAAHGGVPAAVARRARVAPLAAGCRSQGEGGSCAT